MSENTHPRRLAPRAGSRRGAAPARAWRTRAALALALLAGGAPGARALDLPGALREVAAANPTLAGRRAEAEAARHRIAPAGAWPSPMVELGALDVPASGRFDADPMTMRMVGLTQSVPLFGANRLRARAAASAADAAEAGVAGAGYELFALAWEAYADAYYAGRLAAGGHAHQDDMEQLVGAARARYAAGNGRLDDLLRAQAEQARTLADVAGYAAEEQGARARLAALMGRDGAALADSLAAPPTPALPDDPAPILAAVDAEPPQLAALRAQAERWRLAARAARRGAWPDLQLGLTYGLREPILGVPQDDLWSATLGFELPVFAGRREQAEGAELDAMARASDADVRAATLELEEQARTLHASALSARRTVALLADTVVATQQRAVAASWSAYDAGSTDLWRVLEAAHALYEEQIALTRARQDLARDEAKLLAITARADLFGLTPPQITRSQR